MLRVNHFVVIRLGTQEAEGLSKSDVAKRMKVGYLLKLFRNSCCKKSCIFVKII